MMDNEIAQLCDTMRTAINAAFAADEQRIAALESQLAEAQDRAEKAERDKRLEHESHRQDAMALESLRMRHDQTVDRLTAADAALREAQVRIKDLEQIVFEETGVHPSSGELAP